MVRGLRRPTMQCKKMKEPVGAETDCQQLALFVADAGLGALVKTDRAAKKKSVTSRRSQDQYLYLSTWLVGQIRGH